ncbi:MAG: hypothetical protein Q9170_000063 [Blastenia crenularia]
MTDLGSIFARLGLGQYLDRFLAEGFEAWETVLDITESDLDALGVKLGHRRRLQREIANTQGVDIESILNVAVKTEPQHLIHQSANDYVEPCKADEIPRGKRKYRRHPKLTLRDAKADDHAPDRPQSAYVIFSNSESPPLLPTELLANWSSEIRDDLKPENLSFTDIAKRAGELWQALTPEGKKPFEAEAGSAKEEYLADLAQYKTTDNYKQYTHYLADFKATHPPMSEGKKPKYESQTGTTSNESAGRRIDLTQTQHDRVTQEAERPLHRGSLEPHPHRDKRLQSQPFPFWFASRPGFSSHDKSPLSDYQRPYHPPPSFVQQSSTSSSKSTSQSSDPLETAIPPKKAGEEPRLYRLASNSSRGSDTVDNDKMDGVEFARSKALQESLVRSVYSQDHQKSAPSQSPPLSNLPPDHRIIIPPMKELIKSHQYHTFPGPLSKKRKESELDGALRPDVDPLSVLAYAGGIMDRKSRETC